MAELEQTTSAREIRDWSDYYAVEPWGAERDNMHAGIITAMIFNRHRNREEEPRTFADYMLREPGVEAESKMVKFVTALRAMAKPKRK